MLVLLVLAMHAVEAAAAKPHIISILQDDLGWYDTGIHSANAAQWTGNITALAKEGISLNNHYVHWHCSPTRRSFLTGRLPIHHGEQLSPNSGDDIDLRMTWISQKMQSAGYETHMFGKWHIGFRSMQHLPYKHAFTTAIGSLQTGGDYSGPTHTTRWQDDHPIWSDEQFTNKPEGCGSVASVNCSQNAFMENTKLPCGTALKFVSTSSAAACCSACADTAGCTHWVYSPTDGSKASCHIKGGTSNCPEDQQGVTSGMAAPTTSKCTNEYSTDLWGQLAVQALEDHDASKPFYMHLCFQAVHTPYDKAPHDPTGNVYHGMVWRADMYIGQLMQLLKFKGMWENTLIVYSSDNGGTVDGINYPLRGEKHSNWEGGMRAASFVSGGLIPSALHGTTNEHNLHIVDWYATFATLAGVSPKDDPPVPPASPDADHPYNNIYGEKSFPPADGVNVWEILMNPSKYPIDHAHPNLVLSKEVMISGKYKLLVSQPHFKTQNNGWKQPNGKWRPPNATEKHQCMAQDLPPNQSFFPAPGTQGGMPCLYDLRADPGEHVDLASQNVQLVMDLWKILNNTILTQRDCNGWSYAGTPGSIPGPKQPDGTTSCSPPALIGHCNKSCALSLWDSYGKADGPICGVPGC